MAKGRERHGTGKHVFTQQGVVRKFSGYLVVQDEYVVLIESK
ncbi:hypothetical protein BACCOPRO_02091 [Phocaeicola coprophilus DSM 18228 = JCM 13818]|uniref:Uncharacterized protein n=1 Tax=Phocaeicola coprophilus DSM 18228 = JCM 13818 TaxID=547042 RepID=S0FDP3_9BACT|nr:hypothetical protein BACCOPRO_02091 [Phocaeicola coprophilus DSM 18228 = JCM 13818]